MGIDIVGIGLQPSMDVLDIGKNAIEVPGGNIANTLIALQSLGVKTGYMGIIGSDNYGIKILDEFSSVGIDTKRLRQENISTPFCKIKLKDGERTLKCHGVFKVVSEFLEEDKNYLKDVDGVFSRLDYPVAKDHLEFAEENGLTTFVTIHDTRKKFLSILDSFAPNYIFANENESGMIDIPSLTNKGAVVIVTMGVKGCKVYGNGIVECPAYRIDAIDTTGAGDAFAAGYIYGVLKKWDELKKCKFANAVGALATLHYGARTLTSPQSVLNFIDNRK